MTVTPMFLAFLALTLGLVGVGMGWVLRGLWEDNK